MDIRTRLGHVVLSFALFLSPGLLAQSTSGSNTSGSTSGGSSTTSTTSTSGSTSGGPSTTTKRQVSLHIPDESAPPGGMVQMKFLVTEPTPISSGGPRVPVPKGTTASGIQLFNPNGDVDGVAMITAGMVTIASISSTGTQGSDYPIMVVSLQVAPDISAGTKMSFALDPSSTWTLGLLGTATLKPLPPATITVGGSISIINVVPGGGLQPGGTVVHVQGLGFQSLTQVQLSNIKASSITVVSPEEIQIVLAEPTQMTGKKIQVTNPDGSQDTYFSYMRGIALGQSNEPLLASALPIFSSVTHAQSVFASGLAATGEFCGIAAQNSNLNDATVTFTLFTSANEPLGSSTIVIPSGYRLMREFSELTGVAPPAGSYVVVSSDEPIHTFGFLGDNVAGTVVPYSMVSSQP